jgi:dipicolinate synthase subunit B
MKLAYAFCGSFCTHGKALDVLEHMAEKHDITPVFSEITASTDTRFGTAIELYTNVKKICKKEVITTIKDAEEIITRGISTQSLLLPVRGTHWRKSQEESPTVRLRCASRRSSETAAL